MKYFLATYTCNYIPTCTLVRFQIIVQFCMIYHTVVIIGGSLGIVLSGLADFDLAISPNQITYAHQRMHLWHDISPGYGSVSCSYM